MVREAQVSTTYSIKAVPEGAQFKVLGLAWPGVVPLVWLLSIVFFIVALVTGMIAILSHDPQPEAFMASIGSIGLIMASWMFAFRKKDWIVIFNDDGIIFEDHLYRYKDIRQYGSGNLYAEVWAPADGPIAAAGAVGHNIYIQHGTRKKIVIDGMRSEEASAVWSDFQKLMVYFNSSPSVE
jgi:hypothetical protein